MPAEQAIYCRTGKRRGNDDSKTLATLEEVTVKDQQTDPYSDRSESSPDMRISHAKSIGNVGQGSISPHWFDERMPEFGAIPYLAPRPAKSDSPENSSDNGPWRNRGFETTLESVICGCSTELLPSTCHCVYGKSGESVSTQPPQDGPGPVHDSLDVDIDSPNAILQYAQAFFSAADPIMQIVHAPTLFGKARNVFSLEVDEHQYGERCAAFLGAAAIGAHFRMDCSTSALLVRAAMNIVDKSLERHRRTRLLVALSGNADECAPVSPIPLCVVQAMILVVIYGQICSERPVLPRIGSYCTALRSLARAAEATKERPEMPRSELSSECASKEKIPKVEVGPPGIKTAKPSQVQQLQNDIEDRWFAWKLEIERQRCLASIHSYCEPDSRPQFYGRQTYSHDVESIPWRLWAADSALEWQRICGC